MMEDITARYVETKRPHPPVRVHVYGAPAALFKSTGANVPDCKYEAPGVFVSCNVCTG